MRLFLFALLLLTSCTLYEADMSESYLEVRLPIDSVRVARIENLQVTFDVWGHAPDACTTLERFDHTFRTPDSLEVVAWGRRPEDALCAQVIVPFEARTTVTFPASGTYRVIFWPGKEVRTITLP